LWAGASLAQIRGLPNFALFLRRFLTAHLAVAGLGGYWTNTIVSYHYRDAIKLLICYFRDERSIPPEKLTLELTDVAAITGFIDWLHTSRHKTASPNSPPSNGPSSPTSPTALARTTAPTRKP
jgi:hypothetical protein